MDGEESITYVTNPNIKVSDTQDKLLIETLTEEFVPYSEFNRSVEDGQVYIETIDAARKITEPNLTSNLSEYGKLHVKEDRGGNVFFFDFTEDNKRIFLKHDSGTYWNIADDGSYTFKAIGDSISIFTGNKKEIINYKEDKVIKEERILFIESHDFYSVGGSQSINIAGERNVRAGSLYETYKQRETYITGTDITRITGPKLFSAGGTFIIESKDTLILRAPNVSIQTGAIKLETLAPFKEEISGEKTISADLLTLSGMNGMSLNTGGSINMSIVGLAREVVGGAGLSATAKKIEIKVGSFETETLLGNISNSAIVGAVEYKNLLGGFDVDLVGQTTMKNLLSKVTLSVAGEAEMKGLLGSVKAGLASTDIEHAVMIKLGGASATEPAVLGLKLMLWLNTHMHGTGVGPSSPPMAPATPMDFNSMKVFVAA